MKHREVRQLLPDFGAVLLSIIQLAGRTVADVPHAARSRRSSRRCLEIKTSVVCRSIAADFVGGLLAPTVSRGSMKVLMSAGGKQGATQWVGALHDKGRAPCEFC